ncbi:hypothetical protein [Reinekea sp. G2M2-21]|uniref:hypothetical protein n=1 Tax=Reinekea sp. G2M2-21 TaxID=2788942 RepID=UPI0018ABC7B4|nr:hypothetical protein [Reinekea sp. G2M2-21]
MNTSRLPRLLKEPTGWVMIVLVIGFFYMQWPTHVRTSEQPSYYVQTLNNGFQVEWEQEPQLQSVESPRVWGLTRKGMSFLVQTDTLTEDFAFMVSAFAERDRSTVGGAVQEPLEIGEDYASYSFFDAENRIQSHRVFLRDGQWVKVSVLYKPSMESRVERAHVFLANAHF